ncbi:hypothetical protein [Kitasatospora sp. MBT66]|uniref:hypothetical protein n=1 Tax=Kitasatospora sp. MBT66 TaxID=1444769 RepID=UPI0005B84F16|nr:hypothetical protein [Kitasatospora sp. MBT66]
MSTPPAARRALGPGAARALGPQRPQGRQPPPWGRPVPVPDLPAHPDAPQPAERAVDAIAALRMVRAPAAVLEAALHLAQALLDRPGEDPLLLEAAEGLAAVIPQHLAAARQQPAPPTRLRPAPVPDPGPDPTVAGTGRLLA